MANLLDLLGAVATGPLLRLAATADAIPCSPPRGKALFGSTASVLQEPGRHVPLSCMEEVWVDRVCREGVWEGEMCVDMG